MGEIGISYSDFWQMTIPEIINAQKGYIEKCINDWRRARWLGAVMLTPHSKEPVSPHKLHPLPGDNETVDYQSEIDKLKERRKWRTQ